MSIGIIVLLIVLGLIFVMLEILVIPGVGVVGVIGGLLIIVGIYGAYLIGLKQGHIALFGSLIASVLAIYFSLKSSTWKNAKLSASLDGKVNTYDGNQINVGDSGITISRLANFGKAKINDEIFEVESKQGFLDVGVPIVVVKIEGNKILVKADE